MKSNKFGFLAVFVMFALALTLGVAFAAPAALVVDTGRGVYGYEGDGVLDNQTFIVNETFKLDTGTFWVNTASAGSNVTMLIFKNDTSELIAASSTVYIEADGEYNVTFNNETLPACTTSECYILAFNKDCFGDCATSSKLEYNDNQYPFGQLYLNNGGYPEYDYSFKLYGSELESPVFNGTEIIAGFDPQGSYDGEVTLNHWVYVGARQYFNTSDSGYLTAFNLQDIRVYPDPVSVFVRIYNSSNDLIATSATQVIDWNPQQELNFTFSGEYAPQGSYSAEFVSNVTYYTGADTSLIVGRLQTPPYPAGVGQFDSSGVPLVFQVWANSEAPPAPTLCTGFCNVTVPIFYDNSTNTSLIWIDRPQLNRENDQFCGGYGQLILQIGLNPTFVLVSNPVGGCFNAGTDIMPSYYNDSNAVDNSTIESTLSISCLDPAYFCTQKFEDFNGKHYIHNDTEFDQFSGFGVLNDWSTNKSLWRNQVTDFFLSGFEAETDITLNESFVIPMYVGVWQPIELYKNTGQGLAQAVIKKTSTYYTDTPNYRCQFKFATNQSWDWFFTSEFGNCTQLTDRDVGVVPLSFFNSSSYYRVLPIGRKNGYLAPFNSSFYQEARMNELGSTDGPVEVVAEFSDLIETACDLRATTPNETGCTELIQSTTTTVPEENIPAGNFIYMQVPFIAGIAGIAMVLLGVAAVLDYKDGGKRIEGLSNQMGKLFNRIK